MALAKGKNSAEMFKVEGKNAFTGSILESIGTAAKGYYTYKNPGGRKSKSSDDENYWFG